VHEISKIFRKTIVIKNASRRAIVKKALYIKYRYNKKILYLMIDADVHSDLFALNQITI